MPNVFNLDEIARLPHPGDNAAIAIRTLEAGTKVELFGGSFSLERGILEGHRFAVRPIGKGEPVLSWGFPFGHALRDLIPGDVLCNKRVADELRRRGITHGLPDSPTFADPPLTPVRFDAGRFRLGAAAQPLENPPSFQGYPRENGRGTGTRNFVLVLGVSSAAGEFARVLAQRFSDVPKQFGNVDGVVCAAHTEGDAPGTPNNLDVALHALAGFMVHPNVGSVLAVDRGDKALGATALRNYLNENNYALDDVPHSFLALGDTFEDDLSRAEAIVNGWLPQVDRTRRQDVPLSHLKVALQCGGSDAFSGISGNPLAGWLAHQVVRGGGAANLGETLELLGAEDYILSNIRDAETAQKFLRKSEEFKTLLSWHGLTAESNPSGGNLLRGIHNIFLKGLGAARKKHPDTQLDFVIDYAERMREPGYYFMNSPGNDLESVAGQVAAGCNLILFVTGSGSITNFPFVPTIKIVTTTARHKLLGNDLDVNAGAYLDGTPMEEVGRQLLDRTIRVASGERSSGEKAGHSQVSIWRNWAHTEAQNVQPILDAIDKRRPPFKVKPVDDFEAEFWIGYRSVDGFTANQIGLIMPVSLCAGQIAELIAARLNAKKIGGGKVTKFVALPHTEGCGNSFGQYENVFAQPVLGHILHPSVRACLVLEHGCEDAHNDSFRARLKDAGFSPDRFGWASIQLDGGIEKTLDKAERWFAEWLAEAIPLQRKPARLKDLRVGFMSDAELSGAEARSMAETIRIIAGSGGKAVVPENAPFLSTPEFKAIPAQRETLEATLPFGERMAESGLHVMQNPSGDWLETATGLAATGADVILGFVTGSPRQGHRIVPIVQATSEERLAGRANTDFDIVLSGDSRLWGEVLLDAVTRAASGELIPASVKNGNVGFQLTRGLLGLSV
jgi:altronate dehydratase